MLQGQVAMQTSLVLRPEALMRFSPFELPTMAAQSKEAMHLENDAQARALLPSSHGPWQHHDPAQLTWAMTLHEPSLGTGLVSEAWSMLPSDWTELCARGRRHR